MKSISLIVPAKALKAEIQDEIEINIPIVIRSYPQKSGAGGGRWDTRWVRWSKDGCATTSYMRWAESYSIVDHNLLHHGYLGTLSHQALALYLFLVVVGNRQGESFYGEEKIQSILRLSEEEFVRVRTELTDASLIYLKRPFTVVRNLGSRPHGKWGATKADLLPQRGGKAKYTADCPFTGNLKG
jgi:hypothetical protein